MEVDQAEYDSLLRDALRYRWLRETLHRAVGGGVEVNDEKEEVRVYWYPTPVSFYESKGKTLDAAIDARIQATTSEPPQS